MSNDELLIALQDMFEKKAEEVKCHTGALVEDLHKDIKAIAEGHFVLDRKIDILQKEMQKTRQELEQEIYSLKKDIAIVKDYVIGVDEKINEHDIILKRVK